jgi:hypothetical protein
LKSVPRKNVRVYAVFASAVRWDMNMQ